MIICILQKGTMGTLLYLNSQEEEIILDHTAHVDHSQLKPEQVTIFLGTLPGAFCQCSWLGFSQKIRLTRTSRVCWERIPLNQTNIHDSAGCSPRKLHKTGAEPVPFHLWPAHQELEICTRLKHFRYVYLYTTETFQICIFVHDWNTSFPWHSEVEFDSLQR